MRTITQTAILMATFTLISKIFGFIREMVVANYFGTSYVTDAYVMAVSIPGMIFTGILMSIATAYMPLLSDKIEGEGEESASFFTSQMINILFIISLIAAIIGLIFSDQIVSIFAIGFHGEVARLTSFFVKVTFSYLIFTSVSGIFESYLQYKGIFLVPIIVGYVQNLIVISIVVLSAIYDKHLLAFGLLIAYGVRFVCLLLLANKQGLEYNYTIKPKGVLRKVIPMAIPVFVGSSISQISIFVDKTLASRLPEGSVAALNYASLLNTMVMALTITILTTLIYPKLTQAKSLEEDERFSEIFDAGFTLIFMLALPLSIGAMLYNEPIVQIVYERGAFDSAATILTQSAYFYYSLGLLFIALNDLLVRVYYSLRDMRIPMICGGISVIIDIILNFILVRFMEHNGLALATSIGAMCNTVLLYLGIKFKYPEISILKTRRKLGKIAFSAIIALICSALFYRLVVIPNIHIIRIVGLFLTIAVAIAVYYVLLNYFKISELRLLKQLRKNRTTE